MSLKLTKENIDYLNEYVAQYGLGADINFTGEMYNVYVNNEDKLVALDVIPETIG